jgi:hypothetical protein
MAFDNGHALLIGVGTYSNAPKLNVPVTTADAEQVAIVLGDPQFCGYPTSQVTLLRDDQATRAGILQALDDLAARAGKDDTVVLFYSGHGHYGEDDAYYLTTNDMQLTASGKVANGTAVRQDELLAKLQRLQAERVLLIFNACHSGEISPTLAGDDETFTGAPLPAPTAAALLSTGSGRVIITACRENQYAYVGEGDNTIFVQALVDGLRGQGVSSQRGFISAFDLYTRLYFGVTETVQQTVPAATRKRYSETQEPELTVLKGVGPFAVALYKGTSATLGDFSAPEQPAPGTAVRAVDEAESRAQLRNITQNQTGGINFGVDNTIGQIADVVGGDKIGGDSVSGDKIDAQGSQGFVGHAEGAVTQNFGEQHTVNTGGGDSAGGNIDKSSGTHVAGSQFNLSGNFGGSNVNVGSTLTNVNQSIGAMPQADQAEKDQLKQLIEQLHAALQQAPAERQADAEAVATFAQQLVENAVKPQPNKPIVQGTGMMLKQAAENIAGVLPTVLTIATRIVDTIGKLVP